MELYPIYDENSPVSPNIWYSISGVGECPMMRVGHTVVHLKENHPNEENKYKKGKLYFIGGANPSNCFNDVYFFDFDKLSWDKHEDMENFESGRYEHTCFLNEKNECLIFGGASEKDSFNDVLKFNFEHKTCQKVECTNSTNQPNPRTIHVGTSYKNQILFFGGGQNGKTPVDDQKVYIFNDSNKKWIALTVSGNVPANRHGHIMINCNDELIFLHGGMQNENLFDDLYALDLKTMSWSKMLPKITTTSPCSRAAHGGVNINKNLFIFGGINAEGSALDDLWKYDIENNQWSLIEIFGYKPPARLDFAYCKVSYLQKKEEICSNQLSLEYSNKEKNEDVPSKDDTKHKSSIAEKSVDSIQEEDMLNFLLIHGGMDTEGNVFDDLFFINLE